jgi:hypothetical protein
VSPRLGQVGSELGKDFPLKMAHSAVEQAAGEEAVRKVATGSKEKICAVVARVNEGWLAAEGYIYPTWFPVRHLEWSSG